MSIAFERAKKTFLGFLQARGKTRNTIRNYASDLETLGSFLKLHRLDFTALALKDVEAYYTHLKSAGLRPNSCRRKLITAKTFLRYLSNRMDVSMVGVEKAIPPEKVERPARLVPLALIEEISKSQPDSDWGVRNRALIAVLLETGMLVSEALALRQRECSGETLQISGRRGRAVRVSKDTAALLKDLSARLAASGFKPVSSSFFYGHSKSGPLSSKLSARGVELLFAGWAKQFRQPHLHPRTLRHLYVGEALRQGKSQKDIMDALGLKTAYAFRVYSEMFGSNPALQPHVDHETSGGNRPAVEDGKKVEKDRPAGQRVPE